MPPAKRIKKTQSTISKSFLEKDKQCRAIWVLIGDARKADDVALQEKLLRECLAICKDFPPSDNLRISTELALTSLLSWQNRASEALPLVKLALNNARRYHKKKPSIVIDALLNSSFCNRVLDNNQLAEKQAAEALTLAKEVSARGKLADCHDALFLSRYARASQLFGARQFSRAGITYQKALENIQPSTYQKHWRAGMAHCCIGVCASKTRQPKVSIKHFKMAIKALKKEIPLSPDDLGYLVHSIDGMLLETKKITAAHKELARALTDLAKATRAYRNEPKTKRTKDKSIMHGVHVSDPYRWLENIDDDDVIAWSRAQNEYSDLYLCTLQHEARITKTIQSTVIGSKPSVPFSIKGTYYFIADTPNASDKALWTMTSKGKRKRIILHPDKLVEPNVSGITNFVMSSTGRHVAYGMTKGGSEWQTWKIYDLFTARKLKDELTGLIHEYVLWLPNGKEFLYIRHSLPEKNARASSYRFPAIFLHRLGTAQSEDRLIYERKDKPKWYIGPAVAFHGKLAILTCWTEKSDRCIVVAKYLDKKKGKLSQRAIPIFERADASYRYFASRKNLLYFITDKGADKGRVIAVPFDLKTGKVGKFTEVIAEQDRLLDSAYEGTNHLILQYLKNGQSQIEKRPWTKLEKTEILTLPFDGTVTDVRWVEDGNTYLLGETSYIHPEKVLKYSPKKLTSQLFMQSEKPGIGKGFTTTLVEYASKDGTMIPMQLVHKKNVPLDGNQPVLLYAYGGFGRSLAPEYSYDIMSWLKLGGVYAAPLLRGGQDLGSKWHTDAILEGKEKTIEDIASAAQWLIANSWTNSKKLAVYGGSNGGLMVAATMVRYPQLFGAVIVINGLYDMLRYHHSTVAWTWLPEYGSAENKTQFQFLRKYSPLHNLKRGVKYPPVLISAARGDDRVLPWHSFKFASALKGAQGKKGLVLLQVEEEAGHAWSRPSDRVKDQLLFLTNMLKMEF